MVKIELICLVFLKADYDQSMAHLDKAKALVSLNALDPKRSKKIGPHISRLFLRRHGKSKCQS